MSSITKGALAASFKKLLSSRPLNKVTVKDIVEDAGVNRQTFYYHFSDIYNLIGWIVESQANLVLSDDSGNNAWHTSFIAVLEGMRQERSLVMNVFHSLSREHLERYLNNVIYPLICDELDACVGDLNVSDDDKKFIADFYKFAFVGILLEWVRKGMKDEPADLVDKLLHMLDGELRRSLEKLSV